MNEEKKFSSCPKCGAEIDLVSYEGMSFESCPNCHGFFLQSHEYITNKEDLENAPELPERLDSKELDLMEIKCPSCGILMAKCQPEHRKHLTLDICPSCLGIWFDQGEYAKYRGKLTNKLFKPKKFRVKFSCDDCKVTEVSKTSREIPVCPRCQKLMTSSAVGIDFEADYKLNVLVFLGLGLALAGLFMLSNHYLTTSQAILITGITGIVSVIGLSFFVWRKLNDDFFPGPFIFPYR